jgi:hypothetical protein
MLENSRRFTITSAQLLAMFGTPQTIVPAPKAGYANIFRGLMLNKPAGTAYTIGTAAGLSVKYTDGSGLEVSQIGVTGFLDQATAQSIWSKPHTAASGANTTAIVAAAPLVLQVLTANVTVGTGGLRGRVFYMQVPIVP